MQQQQPNTHNNHLRISYLETGSQCMAEWLQVVNLAIVMVFFDLFVLALDYKILAGIIALATGIIFVSQYFTGKHKTLQRMEMLDRRYRASLVR